MKLKFSIPLLFLFTLAVVKASESESIPTPKLDVELDGLANDALSKLTQNSEPHVFAAEVDKMMKIIINSLYKNKEIFLRELISNASDALDKIRILSLKNSDVLKANSNLYIFVKADKENKQLIIRDSGIGMTKADMTNNLGTIARSGTSDFLSKFQAAKSESETTDLIGQFGVGFYSAFLVADKITVISKHNDDKQYIWESDSNSYSITEDPRGDTLKRGTEIILHLKEEAQDYLKDATLKEITKKYSQFINFPIYLWESETKMEEVETPETAEKVDEGVEEDDKKKPTEEKKKVEKTYWDWKQVNSQKPIWKRSPSEVTKEEYTQFFKAVTPKSYETLLSHIHFTAEGDINFNAILFIPEQTFGDPFSTSEDREKAHIKLYVRRVFITDELQDIIPRYLSFVRGVVDSEDLPLNVSRETLQQSKLLRLIKKKLIRKIIEMIQRMDKETYQKFWKRYSVNLKIGCYEDRANSQRIAKLLLFKSTHNKTAEITLGDYVGRMKKGQDKIFYMTGSTYDEASQAPFVEKAKKMGYEVLLLTDSVDEYMMTGLSEFEGKKFQNLAKEGVQLHETEEGKAAFESLKSEFEPLIDWLTKEGLKDKIAKATVSNLLTDSPCALVTPEHGWSGSMERLMLSNAYKSRDDPSNIYQMSQKRTLEINPRHPLVKELKQLVSQNPNNEDAHQMARMLFDTATLRSGFVLQDTVGFAERIESLMRKNLGISNDELPEEDPHFVLAPEQPKTPVEESEKEKTDEGEPEEIAPKDEL